VVLDTFLNRNYTYAYGVGSREGEVMVDMLRVLIGVLLGLSSCAIIFLAASAAVDISRQQTYKQPPVIRMGPNR
jgi:hypothetical protein